MRTRLTLLADVHAGSTTGLAPREAIPHPEGMTISPTPASRWLWGHYDEMLGIECTESQDADCHILVLNGDMVDGGMHHGNIQLYHPHKDVESWIAWRIIEEAIEALEPHFLVMMQGTTSHVGKMGTREETLGKKLENEHPELLVKPEHRYAWQVFRGAPSGVLIDIRHHGKMGLLPHTRESYQARYAFDVWSSQAMYKAREPASLAIRAHKHKYADSGPVPPNKTTTRLISQPCFQLATEWIYKMAIEDPPDIGMVGITLQDGRVREVFPQIVNPQINEGYVWTP